jgi:hypothetical protein
MDKEKDNPVSFVIPIKIKEEDTSSLSVEAPRHTRKIKKPGPKGPAKKVNLTLYSIP